jgi:hypothetical protein
MPNLTRELVNRYIESAQPFVESKAEQLAIELASRLNSPAKHRRERNPKRKFVAEMHCATDKPAAEVLAWQDLALKELHIALCTRSSRYRKQVDALKHNSNLLIASIAGYLAGSIGVAVAIVAALVAALLRLVCSMGISIFCKKFKAGML